MAEVDGLRIMLGDHPGDRRFSLSRGQLESLIRGSLDNAQYQINLWMKNQPWYADQEPWELLLGVQEEVGELARAHLKAHQRIRGTPHEWEAKGYDAVGDILIFLIGYCVARGWTIQECLDAAMAEVLQRDWNKFPLNGRTE